MVEATAAVVVAVMAVAVAVAVADVSVEVTAAVSAEVAMILIDCVWFYYHMLIFVCFVLFVGTVLPMGSVCVRCRFVSIRCLLFACLLVLDK